MSKSYKDKRVRDRDDFPHSKNRKFKSKTKNIKNALRSGDVRNIMKYAEN
jgi:hypothetical protein